MNRTKEKNIAMITIAAVILVVANLGVWLAANEGVIAPVSNSLLWSGFVALNVASILWAVVLLGLQPMVVSLSYVAGGFLAYKGVEGMAGISVAEVTTAGATYGAFGALAVGNLTTKVRLAFYNKKQVPFIFIIIGLLVMDAVLNSGISSAGGHVILNAMIFPFVLAGVIFGLIWTVMNHFGIGYNPRQTAASEGVEIEASAADTEKEEHHAALRIQVPEQVEEDAEMPDAVSETLIEPEVPQVAVEKTVEQPAASLKGDEDEFFPLEIDNNDEFVMPVDDSEFHQESDVGHRGEPFTLSSFDSGLYASGAETDVHVGVIIEEPVSSVSLELDEMDSSAEEDAPETTEDKDGSPPISEESPEEDNQEKSEDWLSGHLDLLNKLK